MVTTALLEGVDRDAALMSVGEGTDEIQRTVIAAQLMSRGGI
jgi:alkylation response protein AidB-like acyl-CoA dehydrogenase